MGSAKKAIVQKMIAREGSDPRKLNIGSGNTEIEGYESWDIKDGKEAYPLDVPTDTIDEIRASHILEHFPHQLVQAVITEWVRALRPGGVLKIAVPDFRIIAQNYIDGTGLPTQGYVMGGQQDEHDFHKTIFDEIALREEMRNAGLRNIRRWKSEIQDCASYPISLNLSGEKIERAPEPVGKVQAVMSIPRLGFMDNFFSIMEAMVPLKIPVLKFMGAFWGPCLTRSMEEAVNGGAEWILTMDYDSIFEKSDVIELLDTCARYSEIDALACVQASRTRGTPLFTMSERLYKKIQGEKPGGPVLEDRRMERIDRNAFDVEIMPVSTANFGLTMIRVSSLLKMEKPWFKGDPGPDLSWGEKRIDDDIWFWKQFEKSGLQLYLANRVCIGHAELMIRWPDENLEPVFQHPIEFGKDGKYEKAWK
jgi:SAM-dependent methyltransferase